MKKLFLSIILFVAIASSGFSYELSANPDGVVKSKTWKVGDPGWTSAKRNIQINMDVYNLDVITGTGISHQAHAKVSYNYTNNLGVFTSFFIYFNDTSPIKTGPGSVGPFVNPGQGMPYSSINSLTIEVYRATTAGRAMAWARADLWW
jgi:hypothetical protein